MSYKKIKKDPFSDELEEGEEKDICEKINNYDWFYSIEVSNGIFTKGSDDNRDFTLKQFGLIDFKGKTVLDVCCSDGFYSFESEKRKARKVISIDKKIPKGLTEFLIPHFKSKIETKEISLFKFKPNEQFDIVTFVGALCEVRYPLLALNKIKKWVKPNGYVIIETAMFLDDNKKAILHCPNAEQNPYKNTFQNTFFNHKGLIDNMAMLGFELINIHPDNRNIIRTEKNREVCRDSFLFKKKNEN